MDIPTDLNGLLWVVVIVLASVVGILAKAFYKRMESDKAECRTRDKKCEEDRKAAQTQTLAFARVMGVVAQRMAIPDGVQDKILGEMHPHEQQRNQDDSTGRFFKHG